jgi:hypothetical protein
MDIKNLLCVEQKSLSDFHCPSPLSISSWSSASSDTSETPSLSPVSSPVQTRSNQQTRTPWSAEEDDLLKQGYSQGLSWGMVSSTYLPHRSRGCCWGRFKTLQTKFLEKKAWSDVEDRLLTMSIKKHARLFKHAWRSVAHDLNNRDWRECELRSARMSTVLHRRHATMY